MDYESEYAYLKRAKGMFDEALDRAAKALKIADSAEDPRQVEIARTSILALQGGLLAEANDGNKLSSLVNENCFGLRARRQIFSRGNALSSRKMYGLSKAISPVG